MNQIDMHTSIFKTNKRIRHAHNRFQKRFIATLSAMFVKELVQELQLRP